MWALLWNYGPQRCQIMRTSGILDGFVIVVLITYVILVLENAGPLNPRLGARQALWPLGLTLTDYYIKKNPI